MGAPMLRAVSEFFRPTLKCERIGHLAGREWRRGDVRPTELWSRAVVERVEQERDACRRCGAELSPWTTKSVLTRFTGYSAPTPQWDAIKAGGYWTEAGRRTSPQLQKE